MKNSEEDYLYFQKECRKKDLLVGKKTVIGIHGIVGSFTDEALYRFAQEALGIKPEQYVVNELIHAENVVRSVVDGESDRGIFAVSNSGSGS